MPVMGCPFIFNEIPSEAYNASLVFLEEQYTKRPSGGQKQFTTDNVRGNSRAILLDVSQTEPLSFGIEIVFDDPVDIQTLTQVKNWLCSPLKYCKLRICAEGFENYYYNCYINLDNDLIYNGGYRGVTGTVTCDAPWAWENEQTIDLEIGTSTVPAENRFLNYSQDANPMKPIISFTVTESNSDSFLAIEDVFEDSNGDIIYDKTTIFVSSNAKTYKQKNGEIVEYSITNNCYNLVSGEQITFNNQTALLTSSVNQLFRINNFNKVFLRIPQGVNKLYVSGLNISNLKMTYTNAKRLGGGWY
jgi:uncharacterized protein YuzB (UPF0349 family)